MTIAGATESQSRQDVTLVIGDMDSWVNQGREIPDIDGYHFVDSAGLTPAFLRDLAPDVILSALVGSNFDAVEISRKLGLMDYAGAYRVLTQNVPDVALIIRELRSVAPLLDVDVIDLTHIFPDA